MNIQRIRFEIKTILEDVTCLAHSHQRQDDYNKECEDYLVRIIEEESAKEPTTDKQNEKV